MYARRLGPGDGRQTVSLRDRSMNKPVVSTLTALAEGCTTEFKQAMPSDLGKDTCAIASAIGSAMLTRVGGAGRLVVGVSSTGLTPPSEVGFSFVRVPPTSKCPGTKYVFSSLNRLPAWKRMPQTCSALGYWAPASSRGPDGRVRPPPCRSRAPYPSAPIAGLWRRSTPRPLY